MSRAVKGITILVVCVLACIPLPRGHASTREPVLPELRSAAMSIPWSDFKDLLSLIQPAPPPEEEKPPVDWTVGSAIYDAKAVGQDTVHVRANMEIVVWKPKGWVRIPVIGDSVAPISAMLDGEKTSLVPNGNGWFTLMLDEPGRHAFETVFFVASTFEEGVGTVSFPCARTPLTSMALRLPMHDAHVSSPGAANVSVTRGADALTAEIVFRPTDLLTVNWTLPAALRKPKVFEEARVTCLTATLASVTDMYLTCESRLRYDVLRGEVDTFRLRLPREVSVLNVVGHGAAWSRSESGDGQRIEVKVNHVVKDSYELALKYEAPFENEIATVKVPELVVEDIVRETGYIGVTARGNVEVNASPEVAGLTRIDNSDLPVLVRAMSPHPILLAFKYTEHPYLLAMDVRKLGDVPVRVASIDRAEITTVLTDEGIAVTRVVYDVRNNVKQFLRVDVDEDAEVWGAEVGGQVVKPARDGTAGDVLIPLFKSVETNRRLGSFPVELVYMERLPRSPRLAGRLDLRAPGADILANEVYWQVLVPESQRVYRSQGDLKPVTAEQFPRRRPHIARGATGSRQETLYRLREGVERFLITNLYDPAAAASGTKRYTGEPLAPGKGAGAPSDIAIAGVLPVRIDLPAEGIAHQFKRIIVPQGKALRLSLYTYSSRLQTAVRVILLGLGVLGGLSVGRLIWVRHSAGRAAPRLFAVAAIALILLVAVAATFRATLAPVYISMALGFTVTLLVPWFAKVIAERTAASKSQSERRQQG